MYPATVLIRKLAHWLLAFVSSGVLSVAMGGEGEESLTGAVSSCTVGIGKVGGEGGGIKGAGVVAIGKIGCKKNSF